MKKPTSRTSDFLLDTGTLLNRLLEGTRANLKSRTIFFSILFIIFISTSMAGHTYISKHYEEDDEGNPRDPTLVESFYWTIATATTLGSYNDDVELHSEPGMMFTALVIIGGIGYIVLGVPAFFLPWLEKRIKNLIKPRLPELPEKDHVIVCGFSQTAKAVINELKKEGHEFVVIADFKRLDRVPPEQPDFPLINGDAGESKVLEKAGVKTASSAILLESDENNAFISLSCRRLNPDIHIVAAAWDARNLLALKKTRANKVISPKVMEGMMLGRKALKEHDIDISGELSITDMRLFQHIVVEDSPLRGKDIRSAMLGRFGIIIVGLWHEGELISTISPDTVLNTDDIIIMLATGEGMSLFTGYCGGAIE